ncbi:hypothetical protein EJB05_12031, partial [Eragrostis curvula]
MTNSSLLPLTFLLLVLTAWWPLAGAWSDVSCGGGSYVANSTYEANLRRLVAVLPAEGSAARGHYVDRAIGYWPNQLQVPSRCRSRDGDCAACIAVAFEELERACPFRREASFFSDNCSLNLDEFRFFDIDLFGGKWQGLGGMTLKRLPLCKEALALRLSSIWRSVNELLDFKF